MTGRFIYISTATLAFLFLSFVAPDSPNNKGLRICDQIPPLNLKLIDFVKSNLNKKVGRGECWDLAAQDLDKIGAKWDKNYVFGKEVDLKKSCVFPGDIIQFEGVEIQYKKGNTFYTEELDHHTAIVYKVNNKESFIVAEQNTSVLGKKVGLSDLDLKNVLKGTYKIYRPVN